MKTPTTSAAVTPSALVEEAVDEVRASFELRWSRIGGQIGGFAKLGSGVCHAAMLMPSQAMWTSSGVLPPRAEWGLVRL